MTKASAAVHAAFRVNARRFGDSFRLRRDAGLAALIKQDAAGAKATVRCLDVGGSPVFWETVDPGIATWSHRHGTAPFGTRSCAERTMAPAASIPRGRPAPWRRNGQQRSEPDR